MLFMIFVYFPVKSGSALCFCPDLKIKNSLGVRWWTAEVHKTFTWPLCPEADQMFSRLRVIEAGFSSGCIQMLLRPLSVVLHALTFQQHPPPHVIRG